MENLYCKINEMVNKLIDEILFIEEETLKLSPFDSVTTSELHVINAIGLFGKRTMSEIAHDLHLTVGTLTTSINNLVKKGLVDRFKDERDRRLVYIGLTGQGRVLFRLHDKFHNNIIRESSSHLSIEEQIAFVKTLEKIYSQLQEFEKKIF